MSRLRTIQQTVVHLFTVNRGFLLFALALYALFGVVGRADAAGCYHHTERSVALAACTADTTGSGYTTTCSEGHDINACSSGAGYFVSAHEVYGNYVYSYTVDDSEQDAEACEAAQEGSTDPDSPFYNPLDNESVMNSGSMCKGGCTWAAQGGVVSTGIAGSASFAVRGHFAFTGTVCATPPPEPEPPPAAVPEKPTLPVCTTTGTNQSLCVKQSNQQCYTVTGTSKSICWAAGETGVKTEQNVAQVRAPGTGTPGAPTPPPGETFTTAGTPVTTNITNTSNSTTTTTTVVNYQTENGTNAGNVNQGESGDLSGGDGDDTASGAGGECGTAPTCSGDAIACAQLAEIHLARCAAEEGNMGKLVEGSELDGIIGNDPSPADADAAGVTDNKTSDTADFDDAGFLTGSRSCPVVSAVSFYGVDVAFPYEIVCEWLSIGAFLIYVFAGLASLRIITGGVA